MRAVRIVKTQGHSSLLFVFLWPLGWAQPAHACSPCLSDSSRLLSAGSGALGGMQVGTAPPCAHIWHVCFIYMKSKNNI